MAIHEVQGAGQPQQNYTPVTVKDKNSGKKIVINFANAKVKGNVAEWTIKDGVVYDKKGNIVPNNELQVTKYQAALLKAAAEGDGNGKHLDTNDLVGGLYGENAEKALQEAKSEYHIAKDRYNNPPMPFGDADALEHGKIYANVENKAGQKGHLEINFTDLE